MRTQTLATALLALASAQATAAEECHVVAGSPPKGLPTPVFVVAELPESAKFALPEDAGPVGAVVCNRESPVPSDRDLEVLGAGVPLAIRTPDVTVWLEMQSGQLQVSFSEGTLSTAEQEALQGWLNNAQAKLQRPEGAAGGA